MLLSTFCALLSLLWMGFALTWTFVRILRADRAHRYDCLTEFRKGGFALFYLSGYFLYFAANVENGMAVYRALTASFTASLKLAVLSFDYDLLLGIGRTNGLFYLASVLCFVLSAWNTVVFACTLFLLKAKNTFDVFRMRRGTQDVLILVCPTALPVELIRSVDLARFRILVLAPVSETVRRAAYIHRFTYAPMGDSLAGTVQNRVGGFERRAVRVILNTGDVARNLALATQMCSLADTLGLQAFSLDGKRGLAVYAFADHSCETSFVRLCECSHGCVRYLNAHKILAMEFVKQYPLAAHIPMKYLDTAHAAVRADLAVRVVFVGFGKVNRQIFLTFAPESCLQHMEGEVPVDHPVQYYAFDRENPDRNKNFHHTVFRYRDFLCRPHGDTLPLPPDPFPMRLLQRDWNDREFYRELEEILVPPTPATPTVNLLIVSAGEDLENIDLSQKIYEKCREWGVLQATQIYARIADMKSADEIFHKSCPPDKVIPFGDMKSVVGNIENIISEKTEYMAKLRHVCYSCASAKGEDEAQAEEKALAKWCNQWSQVQRDSNTFACLSLRSKLLLCGFDCVPDTPQAPPDACAEFLLAYQQSDPVFYGEQTVRAHHLAQYPTLSYPVGTLRGAIARLEHARWCAFMIANGYIPATRQEMFSLSREQLSEQRKHANLTTMEGLVTYRKLAAEYHHTSEEQEDVIRYDYQTTDDAPWILAAGGMRIIRRPESHS